MAILTDKFNGFKEKAETASVVIEKGLKESARNLGNTFKGAAEKIPDTAQDILSSVGESFTGITNKLKTNNNELNKGANKDSEHQGLFEDFTNLGKELNKRNKNFDTTKEVIEEGIKIIEKGAKGFEETKKTYKKHATLIEKIGNFISTAASVIKAFPNLKKMQEKWKDFKKSEAQLNEELNKPQYKSKSTAKSAARGR